jgi:beta-xylosidase
MERWVKERELKLTDTEARSPEIHYLKETFWLTYSRKEGGTDLIRFDTADLAASTFHIARITAQGQDPSLFLDDDGKLYWVMGSGQVARLKENPMDGLDEKPVQISITPEVTSPQRDPSTIVGTRGAFMAKIKGRYHLFAADRSLREGWGRAGAPGGAHDTYVASSETIYLGYGHRYIAFPYAGQTTLFRDLTGELWATFSGEDPNSIFEFRPGAFPVEVADVQQTPVFPGVLVRPSRSFVYEGGSVGSLRPSKILTDKEVPVPGVRDIQVITAPDGYYYMTATTGRLIMEYGSGGENYIPLWRSTDLLTWKPVGRPFDLGTDKEKWYRGPTEDAPEIWAPEIHYINGTFWLVFCSTAKPGGNGLLKSTTGKPEGPYEPAFAGNSALVQGDDPTLFQDTDGTVYYVWMNGHIRQLNKEMNSFVTEDFVLKTVDNKTVGYEGVSMAKMGSWYVVAAAEWNGDMRYQGSYDLMYAISKNILGPYTKRRFGIPHAGHSSFFQDRTGRWYATMFGNDRTAPFRTGAGMVPLHLIDTNDDLIIEPG